ncbi:MAG TPA: hypothetical protein VHV54_15705 [Candidatus Binatia bacterium]|nr:hypothetical protein [Candidatus Binatia bacterium]
MVVDAPTNRWHCAMVVIANAIFNATGVRIKTLPLNPENMLRGLKEAGKA